MGRIKRPKTLRLETVLRVKITTVSLVTISHRQVILEPNTRARSANERTRVKRRSRRPADGGTVGTIRNRMIIIILTTVNRYCCNYYYYNYSTGEWALLYTAPSGFASCRNIATPSFIRYTHSNGVRTPPWRLLYTSNNIISVLDPSAQLPMTNTKNLKYGVDYW